MEWTIEKVRELPEDNWLGIKRIGPHAWQIGGDVPGQFVIYTGDGGVLGYVNAIDWNLVREIEKFNGVVED